MTLSEPEGPMRLLTSRLLLLRDLKPLPIRARRPLVFLITLALLVALTGGLAYFQFVIKPNLVKGFISAAFAPKPTAVTAEAARIEQWAPELTAIGTLRAIKGVAIAPQAAGVVTAIHFESGDDVEAGALLINIDNSVEEADLANGLAQLTNAEVTLDAPKDAGGEGQHPPIDASTRRLRRATRLPRRSCAPARSSPRRRSKRPSPAGSACATSISGNMSPWGQAS